MGYYNGATLCTNGHIVSSTIENYAKFCSTCGKETISHCQNCSQAIEGEEEYAGIYLGYYRHSYCNKCGNAFPWTSLIIENAVELISMDEELSSVHKEIIKLALPDLVVETPTTPLAIAKYKKYISPASDYIKTGLHNLLIDVVSETVKKSIWG